MGLGLALPTAQEIPAVKTAQSGKIRSKRVLVLCQDISMYYTLGLFVNPIYSCLVHEFYLR